VLFPLPPTRLASYRESFSNSGAKDDPTDAALLADYLLRHRDQLNVWKPDSPATRELQLLSEARRDAVDQRTCLSNQLTAVLKRYFPQAVALVTGEKKEEIEEQGKLFHRIERRTGMFRRVFQLPVEVVESKVDAQFAEGVLRITLPKPEKVAPKQIEIKG
jgi:transposase